MHNLNDWLNIIFIILTVVWIGKILILRTDKQIVINPLLLGISSLLVIISTANQNTDLFGISIESIRIFLYIVYYLIVVFGVYSTNKKTGVF